MLPTAREAGTAEVGHRVRTDEGVALWARIASFLRYCVNGIFQLCAGWLSRARGESDSRQLITRCVDGASQYIHVSSRDCS